MGTSNGYNNKFATFGKNDGTSSDNDDADVSDSESETLSGTTHAKTCEKTISAIHRTLNSCELLRGVQSTLHPCSAVRGKQSLDSFENLFLNLFRSCSCSVMALLSSTTLRLALTSRSSISRRHPRTTCAAHERESHQLIKIERSSVDQCEYKSSHPSGAVASRRQALQRACSTLAAATVTVAPWLWQPLQASAAEGLLADESETVELPQGKSW